MIVRVVDVLRYGFSSWFFLAAANILWVMLSFLVLIAVSMGRSRYVVYLVPFPPAFGREVGLPAVFVSFFGFYCYFFGLVQVGGVVFICAGQGCGWGVLGRVHVVMSHELVCVIVLGLWVAVNSGDTVGYNNRSVGGFVCYPVRWYIAPRYTSIVIHFALFICPVVL